MSNMTDTPRIYVACLADYNNGVLHGEWIDATQDIDDVQAEINAMLRASHFPNVEVACPDCGGLGEMEGETEPCKTCKGTGKVPSAEEYAIHDYDGFDGLASSLGEFPDLEKVLEIAALIEKHGDAYAIYAAHLGGDDYGTEEDFEEAYQGEFDTERAFAEQLFDDTHTVPQEVANYIDYDAFARDVFMDGYWSERSGGTLYVFRDN